MASESTFECPNCGEAVYQELFACPNCGLVLHPLEEEGDEPEDTPHAGQPRAGFSFGAVAVGWIVSAGLAFLLNVLVGALWPGQPSGFGQALVFLAGPLGALAGGALAGLMAPSRPGWHGLGVAAASLASGYLLEAVRADLSAGPLPFSALASWALMLAAGPLGALLPRLAGAVRLPQPGGGQERRLYQTLLMRVRHDPDTAERLIDMERRRSPAGRRAQWIENAIERIDRDRR